jgi:hypothetical protein
MSFWMIVSWVLVAALTGVNIFVFLKLKGASEQMLKMAFPGAKDMNEALQKMQGMMGAMGGMGGMGAMAGKMGGPQRGGSGNPNRDAQLKAAMAMLQKNQRK